MPGVRCSVDTGDDTAMAVHPWQCTMTLENPSPMSETQLRWRSNSFEFEHHATLECLRYLASASGIGVGSSLARVLPKRTRPVAIRTVHTAIARLWFQHGAAGRALCEMHATIGRHRILPARSARWTRNRHTQIRRRLIHHQVIVDRATTPPDRDSGRRAAAAPRPALRGRARAVSRGVTRAQVVALGYWR